MVARFSAPVQTGHGAQPASYTKCTGSFPGVKRPERGIDHPPPSSAEVKERVEIYLYSHSGPSWPVLGWTLTLILLTWRIWWAPNNDSKWQMGFNSAFKELNITCITTLFSTNKLAIFLRYAVRTLKQSKGMWKDCTVHIFRVKQPETVTLHDVWPWIRRQQNSSEVGNCLPVWEDSFILQKLCCGNLKSHKFSSACHRINSLENSSFSWRQVHWTVSLQQFTAAKYPAPITTSHSFSLCLVCTHSEQATHS